MEIINDLKGANNTYWGNIGEGIKSSVIGVRLTWKHFVNAFLKKKRPPIGPADENYFDFDEGIFTLQYPHEMMPVPDNGRYRLDNEIDDCIVCDKCAKVCPVDCIDIESIKSADGEIRKTSDGSSVRLHAAKFDIDMAKCCYCGLCTTVCPTECLTMTKTFDYSEYDVKNMIYSFAKMTPEEITQREKEYEDKQAQKAAAATSTVDEKTSAAPKPKITGAKPVIGKPAIGKPKIGGVKPVIKPKFTGEEKKETPKPVIKKPAMKPVIKPKKKGEE